MMETSRLFGGSSFDTANSVSEPYNYLSLLHLMNLIFVDVWHISTSCWRQIFLPYVALFPFSEQVQVFFTTSFMNSQRTTMLLCIMNLGDLRNNNNKNNWEKFIIDQNGHGAGTLFWLMKTHNACFMRWFVGFVAICYALFCMTFCMSQYHSASLEKLSIVVKRIWLAVLNFSNSKKLISRLGGKKKLIHHQLLGKKILHWEASEREKESTIKTWNLGLASIWAGCRERWMLQVCLAQYGYFPSKRSQKVNIMLQNTTTHLQDMI